MKYIVVLGDGMADYPVESLGNKTPLQAANKPLIDQIASIGELGLVHTIPDGMTPPGSDIANLSVMGYDPRKYYSGRSPLEAVSIGINMEPNDVAFRCNLVTLLTEDGAPIKDETVAYEDLVIADHSSDEITTAEADQLMDAIRAEFTSEELQFYTGISYRHCMIWRNGPLGLDLALPHDILTRKIDKYMPENRMIYDMMKRSYDILSNHPVNLERIKRGLNPANSIWLWGEGKRPALSSFEDLYGVKGSMISAVDLLKGIGFCAGMNVREVENATGNIHTNFIGKAEATIDELANGQDFVYLHMEAPDECGHRNESDNKILSIEKIDNIVVKYLLEHVKDFGEVKFMILPDHPTPLCLRTHTDDPVPYIIASVDTDTAEKILNRQIDISRGYNEADAKETGIVKKIGHQLMSDFLG